MIPILTLLLGTVSARAETIYWPSAADLARQHADSTVCVNHLKQIGLAADLWAMDNPGRCPTNFLAFTNELENPTPLYCPANHARPAATNWAGVDWGRIDYQWFYHSGHYGVDPQWVYSRCLVHSNYVQGDNSAHRVEGYRSGWPAVIAPPLSQYAAPGSNVLFRVLIAPDAEQPLSYQWRKQRLAYATNAIYYPDDDYWYTNITSYLVFTNLPGQTNATLSFTNVQATNSDFYAVAISNALGVAVSAEAQLWVDPAVPSMATNEYWSAGNCINNLRTLCAFARIWAADHTNDMPHFSTMTNVWGSPVFGWPVVLFCRSDNTRTAPTNWAQVNFDDTSYEVFPTSSTNSTAVYCRCKVHGYYVGTAGAVVSQPNFSSIRSLASNARELNFALWPGRTNVLEVSSNLLNWSVLREYSPANGLCRFTETNSAAQRFYRITTQ